MNLQLLLRASLRNPKLSVLLRSLVFLVMGCAAFFANSSMAQTGYTVTSSSSVQFYANNYAWADLHYTVNAGPQQNVRMSRSGNNNIYTVTGLNSGAVVRYFFTIAATNGVSDTAWAQLTMGGAASSNRSSTASAASSANTGGGTTGANPAATSVQFYANNTAWADVHYTVNSGPQQNIRMTRSGNNNTYTVTGLSSGAVVRYFFTIANTSGGATDTAWAQVTVGGGTASSVRSSTGTTSSVRSSAVTSSTATSNNNPGSPGTAGGTHKRLRIINGCGEPMWVQWLTSPGISFNGPRFPRLASQGSSIEFDIPDRGLPSMRFWPGFGCDANGHNCRVGASGGPANMGFTCPEGGCAPPIDSKFEATFGCIPGVADGDCFANPSAPSEKLGRGDWWNSSFVDGYTAPMKVVVKGYCPVGPQPAPVFGPGGPPGGVIDCSNIRLSDCPTNENLSSEGRFPALSNVNLRAVNPRTGALAGCYSPSAKLTFGNWGNPYNYLPQSPEAQWYACPTPPISPEQCMAGPSDRTRYKAMVHSFCPTYTYAYDDGVGLSSCPAATNLTYEVTFYCPQ